MVEYTLTQKQYADIGLVVGASSNLESLFVTPMNKPEEGTGVSRMSTKGCMELYQVYLRWKQ